MTANTIALAFKAVAKINGALTPSRRKRVYRLATIVVVGLSAHKLTQGDVLEGLAILLGVAPSELAAKNAK